LVQHAQLISYFFIAGGDPTPAGAAHRPVELAQAPDGSLYLSDDKAGWMADLLCRSGSPK